MSRGYTSLTQVPIVNSSKNVKWLSMLVRRLSHLKGLRSWVRDFILQKPSWVFGLTRGQGSHFFAFFWCSNHAMNVECLRKWLW